MSRFLLYMKRKQLKRPKFNFHVITLFPESFESYLTSSIIGRAIDDGYISVKYYNPRDYSEDKFKHIDKKPYGGGPGMVIGAMPIVKAVIAAKKKMKGNVPIIFFTPRGTQFTNKLADTYSKKNKDLILICGRYEGIDARVIKILKTKNISVGPYVLTGGEIPAMIVMDAVSRRVKGVLGDENSIEENRPSTDLVYTRPETIVFKGKKYSVPKVLLSGNHALIDKWRKEKGWG